jgi:hypothetical protein
MFHPNLLLHWDGIPHQIDQYQAWFAYADCANLFAYPSSLKDLKMRPVDLNQSQRILLLAIDKSDDDSNSGVHTPNEEELEQGLEEITMKTKALVTNFFNQSGSHVPSANSTMRSQPENSDSSLKEINTSFDVDFTSMGEIPSASGQKKTVSAFPLKYKTNISTLTNKLMDLTTNVSSYEG